MAELLKEERDIVKRYDKMSWNDAKLNALRETEK
jgi:hypothetical protein